VLGLVREQGWLADRALEAVLRRQKRLYSVERRAAAEATYGILRAQGRIEWLLGHRAGPAELYAASLASSGALPIGQAERRLGLDRGTLAPLAGAESRIAAIEDPIQRLGVEGSLPAWLAERLAAEMGLDEARAFAAAVNVRAPLTVRTNLLKTTRDDLARQLEQEGVESKETPLSPWGLVLDGHANAFGLDAFKGGLFEIQDEGSQLIALTCGARSGMKVVDACAGAGGKTLALAAEMRNRGVLLALDVDGDRLEDARRRARRDGVDNLRTRAIPATDAEADLALRDEEGKADVVLVDAPCSGLGTLRRKPDARWRLGPADPEKFARIQQALVGRFSRLVKPGGRLVYATCSVARAENEEVAATAAALPGFAPLPLERTLGALAGKVGATGNELRLWPHRHGTDGFFVAAFERRKD
jgi:16S rRNA (cytosine967-C5)-methyltransferase